MRFPAKLWNGVVPPLVREKALAGRNVLITSTRTGTILHADEQAAKPPHAWQCLPYWHDGKKRWETTVRPGFVNGQDASIRGVPLLDMEPGDLGLVLPLVEVATRPPRFFSLLGVRNPLDTTTSVSATGGVTIIDDSWKDAYLPPPRQLFSCDIQLSVARMGMAGEVHIDDATGASGRVASFYPRPLTSLLQSRGARPELQAVPMFQPQMPPTLLERMLGTWVDPQEDILHLARIWLLSPPEWDGGPPDDSWAPFAQHFCWWNLAHATRMPQGPIPTNPIQLFTGLAGGLADGIFNQILSANNDATQHVLAAMQTVTAEGRFWTI